MPERLRQGGGLILHGRPGTGKDHLAAACMYWAILKCGWRVEWRDGNLLSMDLRNLVRNQEGEAKIFNQLTRSQILVISDPIPPKGETSQFITDFLQRVVDRRYREERSTWATINVHSGSEAEDRLASPIVDRLRHNSLSLQCEWQSWRAMKGVTNEK